MSRVIDSPRGLMALVLVLLLVFGLGWTFGPRQFGAVFLLLDFFTLFIGGTAAIVVPRRRAAARLAADRMTGLVTPSSRVGFLRRAFWWNITWTVASPLSAAETSRRVQSVIEERKRSSGWPFGDRTTKLHVQTDGFSTAPGWLWNAPFKPVLSGWAQPANIGTIYGLKLGMAYDPVFETMFALVGALLGIGGVVAFIQQGSLTNWQFLPVVVVPLGLVIGVGQFGRWRLKRAGAGLTAEAAAAVTGNVIFAWPGWR